MTNTPSGSIGDPIEGRPSKNQLAIFYAELAEIAAVVEKNYEFHEEDGVREIFYYFCDPDNPDRVIGVVRGWKEPEAGKGLIYDVSVSSQFRGKGYARALLRTAIGDDHRWMRGNPARVTSNLDRELGIVRTVYAIALSLGFRNLTENTYKLWFGLHNTDTAYDKTIVILLAGVIALLGFRMFWAIGNIRRFVYHSIFQLDVPRRLAVIAHVLLLLLHALLFYFICNTFGAIDVHLSIDQQSVALPILCAALLLLNAIWLMLLSQKRSNQGPENSWTTNNLVFGLCLLLSVVLSLRFSETLITLFSQTVILLLLNSLVDFWQARDVYILSGTSGGG